MGRMAYATRRNVHIILKITTFNSINRSTKYSAG